MGAKRDFPMGRFMAGGPKLRFLGRSLVEIGIFSAATNAMLLVMPLYLLQVYDRVLPSSSLSTLTYITILALAALIILGILEVVRSYYADRVAARIDTEMASDAFMTSMSGPRAALGDVQPLRDLATIRGFISSRALFFLFDLPFSPVFIALLYLIHPVLFYVTIFGAVIMVGVAVANQLATAKPGPAGGQLHDGVDEHGAIVRPQFRDGPRARHDRQHHRGLGQEVRGIDQPVSQRVAPQRILWRAVAHAAHGSAERHHVRRRLSGAAERDDGRHDLRCVDHLGPRAAAARPDHRRLAPGHRCRSRLEAAAQHGQGQCRSRQGYRRPARSEGRGHG